MSNQPPQGGSYDDGGGRFDDGARPVGGHGAQPGHPGQHGHPGDQGYGNAPAAGYGNAPGYQGGGPAPVVAKPKSIDLAQKLMYVGALISLLSGLSAIFQKDSIKDQVRDALKENGGDMSTLDSVVNVGIVTSIIIGIIGALLWIFMAVMNGKGKSWARIVATVLGVLGVLFTLLGLTQNTSTPVSMVLGILTALVAIAVLVLLWKRESSEYYQAQSAPRY